MKIIYKGHIYESVMLESTTFSFNVEDDSDELSRINDMYDTYMKYISTNDFDRDEANRLEELWYNAHTEYDEKNAPKNPSVNFADRNTKVILDLLGLAGDESDLYGSDNVDDFIKRIDNAYDLIHTQIIPPTDSLSDKDNGDYSNKARWLDNGLTEEDIKDKLDRLKQVALKGKQLGLDTIHWG